MEQQSKSVEPKGQSLSNESAEQQIAALKKQLNLRENELKNLKVKYEASIAREKELLDGFSKVKSIMEQLSLVKGTSNNNNENGVSATTTPSTENTENTQSKSKKSKKRNKNKSSNNSSAECKVCQKTGHELKDCFYIKEANKNRNKQNEKKSDTNNDQSNNTNATNETKADNAPDPKENDKNIMKGITNSDDEFLKQKKEYATVTGYVPMFPLGLTVNAHIGSKVSKVLVASGSPISTISLEEAERLGLGLVALKCPAKIVFPVGNNFTISTHAVKFAPVIDGLLRHPSFLLVVKKQSVPIILGFKWMEKHNFRCY